MGIFTWIRRAVRDAIVAGARDGLDDLGLLHAADEIAANSLRESIAGETGEGEPTPAFEIPKAINGKTSTNGRHARTAR